MMLRRSLLVPLVPLAALAFGVAGCDTYGIDPPDPDPPDPDPSGDPAEVIGCASRGDLALGGITSATLAATDCVLDAGRFFEYDGGEYVDAFVLRTTDATDLRLDLESTEIDTYLIVTDASGDAVASNDDVVPGGGDTDSRVEATFTPGTYFVLVTSFDPGEAGGYTLTVAVP